MVARNNANEIHLVRVYDAPLQVVWDAWNDPQQAAKWWGPRGFTITTHSKDLRTGGHWFYTMHGPDGTDYVNKTIYLEVEPLKKLVYDHGGNDERAPLFRVTVVFTEADGQTTMDMTMSLPTAEAADTIRKMIKAASGNSTWDRLGEYLDDTLRSKTTFIINRSIATPSAPLVAKWRDAQALATWLPPQGLSMSIVRGQVQVGGHVMFKMTDQQDAAFYGQLEFLTLEPEHIVYVQRFCDQDGTPCGHPFEPDFPEALLATIEFAIEDDQCTRITVVMEPHGATSGAQQAAFARFRSKMMHGWNDSFDKLEGCV